MNNYAAYPETFKNVNVSKREECYISKALYDSYNAYYDNFDQMDFEMEKLLEKYYEGKRYVYSFYINGKGAAFEHDNGFLKLRYKDIIFKIWFI
jgi:hypothetical protein